MGSGGFQKCSVMLTENFKKKINDQIRIGVLGAVKSMLDLEDRIQVSACFFAEGGDCPTSV